MNLRALFALLIVSLLSAPLFAQSTSIQLDRFEPLPSQRTSILNVQRSAVLPDQTPEVGFFFHYTDGPLRLEAGDSVLSEWVSHQFKGEASVAIGLGDVFDIGAILPVVISQGGDTVPSLGESIDSPVIGDTRLVPKVLLVNPKFADGIGLALSAPIYLPSGDQGSFNSVGLLRVEPRVAFDIESDWGWVVAANLGYQGHEQRNVAGYIAGQRFRFSFGTLIPIKRVELLGTMYGDVPLEDGVEPQDPNVSTGSQNAAVEFDAALRINFSTQVAFQIGGGLGASSAVGVPRYRIFGGLVFGGAIADSDGDRISDKDDTCPKLPEDYDEYEDADGCPEKDNDADGIEDAEDECRDEAEDHDGYEDTDGCADPDNDADGVLDNDDDCPDVKGPVDSRGCPAMDSDGDGIMDDADACPQNAEDKDGFEDDDGCPETDNDRDGIPDDKDKCPNDAEVINGVDDTDGCPDKGESKVRVTERSIEILSKVFFDTGKATIKPASFDVLNQVAAVLVNFKEITKVQVEGHTDSTGKDAANLKLSQARAESVVQFLVAKGVAKERLVAKGFGETKPIDEKDLAKNRRVEFLILEVNGEAVDGTAVIKKEEPVEEAPEEKPKN